MLRLIDHGRFDISLLLRATTSMSDGGPAPIPSPERYDVLHISLFNSRLLLGDSPIPSPTSHDGFLKMRRYKWMTYKISTNHLWFTARQTIDELQEAYKCNTILHFSCPTRSVWLYLYRLSLDIVPTLLCFSIRFSVVADFFIIFFLSCSVLPLLLYGFIGLVSPVRFQKPVVAFFQIGAPCEDARCNVWQHINCVIILENPMRGIVSALPPKFYCELCRLGRADPSPNRRDILFLFISMAICKIVFFVLSDRDLLVKPEYNVQAWYMLLNEKWECLLMQQIERELKCWGPVGVNLDLAIRVIVSCIRVRHEFTRHEFGKHEHDTNFNSCLRVYRLSEYRDFGSELKLKTEKGEIGDGDGRVKPATIGKAGKGSAGGGLAESPISCEREGLNDLGIELNRLKFSNLFPAATLVCPFFLSLFYLIDIFEPLSGYDVGLSVLPFSVLSGCSNLSPLQLITSSKTFHSSFSFRSIKLSNEMTDSQRMTNVVPYRSINFDSTFFWLIIVEPWVFSWCMM
ncbi:hypothetical protein LXL04_013237 [Taraxacum kok-saghyz]